MQSFLGNTLSKHSPPPFCHVDEMYFNNLLIFPVASLKMLTPCPRLQGLSDLAPGCLFNLILCSLPTSLLSSPVTLKFFHLANSFWPQEAHTLLFPLPGMFISKTLGCLSCPQLTCHPFSEIFSHHSAWKCPLHLTLCIQYPAFFS